jgi:hypothetical protein
VLVVRGVEGEVMKKEERDQFNKVKNMFERIPKVAQPITVNAAAKNASVSSFLF